MAYEAIERSLRDSLDADLEAEAAALGFPQPAESRVIIERLARMVGGAREADEQHVNLDLRMASMDDVSCLLGVVTGLFLTHKTMNHIMLEDGDFGSAMEVATVGRAIGIAGKRIMDFYKSARSAALN
jgi:hypothetical protein